MSGGGPGAAPAPVPVPEAPLPRGLLPGLFLTAMSVLLLEVAITRVFAILMWHHFAYMVISLALLGFGGSGSLLTAFRGAERPGATSARAASFATLYGVTVILAFLAVTRLRVDSLEVWNEPGNFLGLLLTFVVLSVPFVFAGLAIGTTLTRHPAQVSRLYFVDLLGSALGGAVAPSLLDAFGSTATVMIAAALAAAGGAAYAIGAGRGRPIVHAVPAVLVLAVAAGFAGGRISWSVPFAPHKDVVNHFPDGVSDAVLHSAVAQVDVSRPKVHTMTIGGHFGDVDWSYAELRGMTQDGTAPTALYKDASDIRRFKALDDSQAASGYIAHRARGTQDLDVLVIGCGGGVDVMTALHFDAPPTSVASVTAVDINRAMIRAVTGTYAEYIGRLFDHPKVRLVHAEGRSFLRREERRFDLIQLSGVDTFTALNTGAYTLSESYLYTVEAVKDFYTHLEDGGIINYSRFLDTWPKKARETIRLASIARQALEELGVAEPWRHLAVLQAHGWASTMIRKGPFTEGETTALRRFAVDERFMGLVFDPHRPRGGPYERGRVQDIHCEAVALGALGAAAGELIGAVPKERLADHRQTFLDPVQRSIRLACDGDIAASDAAIQAFAAILPGEMRDRAAASIRSHRDGFLEARRKAGDHFVAQQRDFETVIRGSPEERAAFAAGYDYDLTPSTDDRPFFFDYFRLGRFLDYWKRRGDWNDEYHPDFPVGHGVLLASLLQIAVLAFVLIILPLRPLRRRGVPTPDRLRTFAYFGALGLGFMFIEIGLMQKFTLFLGHPTYSLSVVLSGMLLFSGLGALWSARLVPSRRLFRRILAVILALLAAEILAVSFLLDPLLGLPFPVRAAFTTVLLAPIAFVLGLPFPLGIRLLESRAPALIPWGWAINGFLSVFASLLAIVLAMNTGFTGVILLAAAVYAAGLLLAPAAGADPAPAPR